jgi:hypothetical protein
MGTEQQANFIERVRVLAERGEHLRTQLALNPDAVARYDLDDKIMDLGEELAELRREIAT